MICPHSIHPWPRLRKATIEPHFVRLLPCLELQNSAPVDSFRVFGKFFLGFAMTESTVTDSCRKSFVLAFSKFEVFGSINDLKKRLREMTAETYHVQVIHLLGDLLCLVLTALNSVTCSLSGCSKGKWVCDSSRRCASCILRCLGTRWGCSLVSSHWI